MKRMDRTRTRLKRMSDGGNDDFVPGTPASRIAMVWPLTREIASLSGLDVKQRLQRHITRLYRRKS
jgi:hypothetical protein